MSPLGSPTEKKIFMPGCSVQGLIGLNGRGVDARTGLRIGPNRAGCQAAVRNLFALSGAVALAALDLVPAEGLDGIDPPAGTDRHRLGRLRRIDPQLLDLGRSITPPEPPHRQQVARMGPGFGEPAGGRLEAERRSRPRDSRASPPTRAETGPCRGPDRGRRPLRAGPPKTGRRGFPLPGRAATAAGKPTQLLPGVPPADALLAAKDDVGPRQFGRSSAGFAAADIPSPAREPRPARRGRRQCRRPARFPSPAGRSRRQHAQTGMLTHQLPSAARVGGPDEASMQITS